MKTKLVPIEKVDVAKLSGEELTLLKKFSRSAELKIFQKIAQWSKERRAFEALNVEDLDTLKFLNGLNVGTDFIVDACSRAVEELKARGEEIDKES